MAPLNICHNSGVDNMLHWFVVCALMPVPDPSKPSCRPIRRIRHLQHHFSVTMEVTSRCEPYPRRLNFTPTMMTKMVHQACNLREIWVGEKHYQPSFDCPNLYSTVWPGRRKSMHYVSRTPFWSDRASKFTREPLLVNETRRASGVDRSSIGWLGFAVAVLEWKLFSFQEMNLKGNCAADEKEIRNIMFQKRKKQLEHQNADGCFTLCSANSNLKVKPQSWAPE